MKKGRSQGSGPKIALKKKKTKTEGQAAMEKRMSDFARRASKKKKPTIMYGGQRKRYLDQVSDGAEMAPVFIRAKGEEEWLECGRVSVAKGATISLADAARYQKRLILEHGTRVHRHLQMQSRELLECGLGPAVDPNAEEEVAADTGGVVLIERSDAPSGGTDSPKEPASATGTTCGFLGEPIPDAGLYWSDSAAGQVARDERNVNLNKALGNAAKSAVAVQFSKTLGLRSLG